jgi:hypothetical protein
LFLVLGAMSAATLPEALSQYRGFQLGTDLRTVAKQAGANPDQATVIHRRPALIQQLEWRPQPLGASSQTEPVQQVLFSFYDGELSRIAVAYDRYQTEGLTVEDFVDAILATYGPAKPTAPANVAPGSYGDQEEVIAQWQEAPAQAATLEAKRLHDQEAPQRDAARLVSEEEAAKTQLEKARLVNSRSFDHNAAPRKIC